MIANPPRTRRQAARPPLVLENADDATLLATRFCHLPLQLEGTLAARRLKRLHRELQAHNIVALPHVWLSEEFFNPDGVLGFAIPFYLAHPRLMLLERSQMLEVEGAGETESRRIFRHEAGHAIDEAYAFHSRQRYRLLFGDPTAPYPASYKPHPECRDYVINLPNWYAQAHPLEDFAETFAVWLNPYVDWLRDVDELMCEIAGLAPATIDKTEIEPLSALRHTLAERYAKKREQADNGSAGDTRVTPALDSFARVSPPSLISWNPTVAGIRSAAATFNRSVQAYAWRPRPHRHHADSNRTRIGPCASRPRRDLRSGDESATLAGHRPAGDCPHERPRVDPECHVGLHAVDDQHHQGFGRLEDHELLVIQARDDETELDHSHHPHRDHLAGVVHTGLRDLEDLGGRDNGREKKDNLHPAQLERSDLDQGCPRIGQYQRPDDEECQDVSEAWDQ